MRTGAPSPPNGVTARPSYLLDPRWGGGGSSHDPGRERSCPRTSWVTNACWRPSSDRADFALTGTGGSGDGEGPRHRRRMELAVVEVRARGRGGERVVDASRSGQRGAAEQDRRARVLPVEHHEIVHDLGVLVVEVDGDLTAGRRSGQRAGAEGQALRGELQPPRP